MRDSLEAESRWPPLEPPPCAPSFSSSAASSWKWRFDSHRRILGEEGEEEVGEEEAAVGLTEEKVVVVVVGAA